MVNTKTNQSASRATFSVQSTTPIAAGHSTKAAENANATLARHENDPHKIHCRTGWDPVQIGRCFEIIVVCEPGFTPVTRG